MGPVRLNFREAIAYLRVSLIDVLVHSFSKHSDTDHVYPEIRLERNVFCFVSKKTDH